MHDNGLNVGWKSKNFQNKMDAWNLDSFVTITRRYQIPMDLDFESQTQSKRHVYVQSQSQRLD